MEFRPLGKTGETIPEIGLGTSGYRGGVGPLQKGASLGAFIDTAEMYPVNPVKPETIGRTERIIGLWLEKSRGHRADVILATKHSGEGMKAVREGEPISAKTISETIEGSLRRLKTDYIDLYQFHWPNRGSYHFRQNWTYNPAGIDRNAVLDDMAECLHALEAERKRGTIRHFGLSNESAWGLAQWSDAARRVGAELEPVHLGQLDAHRVGHPAAHIDGGGL